MNQNDRFHSAPDCESRVHELSDESLENITGAGTQKASGGKNQEIRTGFPCPHCGGFITATIYDLLHVQNAEFHNTQCIQCPSCLKVLDLSKTNWAQND